MWAGRSGPVAGAPLTGDEITARVIAAGILAPASLVIVMLALVRILRWLLDRRQLAAWTSTGPHRTRHR